MCTEHKTATSDVLAFQMDEKVLPSNVSALSKGDKPPANLSVHLTAAPAHQEMVSETSRVECAQKLGVNCFHLTPDPVLMCLGEQDKDWEPPVCPRFDAFAGLDPEDSD